MRVRVGLGTSRPVGGAAAAWLPTDLDSLAAWYDASDASTITEVSGAVSQWDDKSGNGRHATQGTGANQPAIGTSTLDSKDVLTFDGANSFMDVPALGISGSQNRFVILVCRIHTDQSQTNSLFAMNQNGGTGTAFRFRLDQPGADSFLRTEISGSGFTSDTLTMDPNDWHSAAVDLNGTQLQHVTMWLDGIARANSGQTNAINTTDSDHRISGAINGARCLDGDIAEIVVLDALPTTAERQKIEGFLHHKWGLESLLDAGHPYKSSAP